MSKNFHVYKSAPDGRTGVIVTDLLNAAIFIFHNILIVAPPAGLMEQPSQEQSPSPVVYRWV